MPCFFITVSKDDLEHYGVLGMKWGVRRYQNKDGSLTSVGKKHYQSEKGFNKDYYKDKKGDIYISKGSVVKRVSTSEDDPTYDNKKYVSLNKEDHDVWVNYLGEEYVNINRKTWEQTYTTIDDLKIAGVKTQGEIFTKKIMSDPNFYNRTISESYELTKTGLEKPKNEKDIFDLLGRNIAYQTSTGKEFVEEIYKSGYSGLFDYHGTNTGAKDPVILINPDDKLTRESNPSYTPATERALKYLRSLGYNV